MSLKIAFQPIVNRQHSAVVISIRVGLDQGDIEYLLGFD